MLLVMRQIGCASGSAVGEVGGVGTVGVLSSPVSLTVLGSRIISAEGVKIYFISHKAVIFNF